MKKGQFKPETKTEKTTEERIRESLAKGEVPGVDFVGMADVGEAGDLGNQQILKGEVMKKSLNRA